MKLATLICFLFGACVSFAGDELTRAEFEALHKELQAPSDELWRSVQWKTGLAEAQAEAVREKKPLFMWSMDGHPLGCT